ncbi:DNA-binding FadR family transcriptional regulator [Duganella sp. 1411]|uniref:FadR/GntR family transcriptional regulator n=1 Tax=Duganella sp. 1411 TaxID=2806572 RepID=UPI001AE1B72F|nr:FadR/GntR family transcriptional regulator [Duganella sp. 1411]MBP1208010.1 DNA-binding FadR family transcriptional regulator [Duganella sp. 1411]
MNGFQPQAARQPEPRMYRVVAERIQELIREQHLAPGARLPAERELAASLRVSRASLREGLIALELGGVVEVRGGSGVYVCEPAASPAALPEAGPGPFEVLSARGVIETEVAAMAAKNASPAALDAIDAALREMERSHEDRSSNELADREFHLAIARATGNTALVGVIDYLWRQRSSLWHRLKEHYRTEELRMSTLLDHRTIFAAIAARDASGARKAMRIHLARVTRTFAGGGA